MMLAWLASKHPATSEASCIQRFLDFDYEVLGQHLPVFDSATRIEWSTPLVEADSVDGLYVLPEYGSDNDEAPYVQYRYIAGQHTASDYAKYTSIELALEKFARRTVLMLNKLNERMRAMHKAQIVSVELTFRLRAPPEQHLLLHCDNDIYNPRSAVFMVGLSNGSAPTVLSASWRVTASDARCRDADPSNTAACASDRAGAATYYPIHACHSRPIGTAPRDVVAVHVRWSDMAVPLATVVAHVVDEVDYSQIMLQLSFSTIGTGLLLLLFYEVGYRLIECLERRLRRWRVMRRLRRLRHNAVFLMVKMLRDKYSGVAMVSFLEVTTGIVTGSASLCPIHWRVLLMGILLGSQ